MSAGAIRFPQPGILPPAAEALGLRLSLIQRAPLFRGASGLQCREIAERARDRRVGRKVRLVEQGEPLRDVILLASGRVKVTQLGSGGQEVILRLVGPGEVVVGLGLPEGSTSAVGVEALEISHALTWDRWWLEEMFDLAPVLHRNALRIVSERLRSMEERCRELCSLRVAARFAHTLLRLMGQIGRPAEGGVLIALSREELAMLTGTTVFTVSRLLSQWEVLGMLRARREAVLIDDPAGLVAVTEDRLADARD